MTLHSQDIELSIFKFLYTPTIFFGYLLHNTAFTGTRLIWRLDRVMPTKGLTKIERMPNTMGSSGYLSSADPLTMTTSFFQSSETLEGLDQSQSAGLSDQVIGH